MRRTRGYIHVYTGNGKGKTTAAIGLALRAVGWNKKVCVFQFFKHGINGESMAGASLIKRLKVVTFAQTHPMFKPKRERRNLIRSLNGLIASNIKVIKKTMRRGGYDIIVLDEIINALNERFLSKKDLLSLMKSKTTHCELILTGRAAPKWLITKADYVTHMRLVKHPYYKGVTARKSIEY